MGRSLQGSLRGGPKNWVKRGFVPLAAAWRGPAEDPFRPFEELEELELDWRSHRLVVVNDVNYNPDQRRWEAVGVYVYITRNLKKIYPEVWQTFRGLFRKHLEKADHSHYAWNMAYNEMLNDLDLEDYLVWRGK